MQEQEEGEGKPRPESSLGFPPERLGRGGKQLEGLGGAVDLGLVGLHIKGLFLGRGVVYYL